MVIFAHPIDRSAKVATPLKESGFTRTTMTMEEFKEHWDRVGDEHYLEDKEHGPNHRPFSSLVEAIGIMSTYVSDGSYHAEHDILYFGDLWDEPPPVTDNDIIRLSQLGIHWDDESCCFAAFC